MPPETGSPGSGPAGRPVVGETGGPGGTPTAQSNALPANPLTGTAQDGAGVTGQSNTGPGISGQSLGLLFSGSLVPTATLDKPAGDGVFGDGNNGVHGVSAAANGVLGENSGSGYGVTGTSKSGIGVYGTSESTDGIYGLSMGNGVHGCSGQRPLPLASGGPGVEPSNGAGLFGESYSSEGVFGASVAQHGVHGVNGFGSGIKPTFGCGIFGETDNGYGVYGASKTASGVYGTSGPGHFAGEFEGDHQISGNALVGGNHRVKGTCSVDKDLTVGGNHTVKGNVTASDVMISGGADCAEEFDLSGGNGIESGSVVVFDESAALGTSNIPYNKKVAGVISGAGSYRPGVVLDRRDSSRERAPLALIGKVFCKVDASYGAIDVGDLLTTSSTHGFAMKAQDPLRSFGAVIGKALGVLEEGRGLIPILVMIG
jgi:hypothetical protein